MLDANIHHFRAHLLFEDTVFLAAVRGGPEAFGVAGIVAGQSIEGVKLQDDVGSDSGFEGRRGLVTLARDHDTINSEEGSEFDGRKAGGGETSGARLSAMGDEPLVPGDVAEEDAIGPDAGIIHAGDQIGEDVLIGIFSGSGVPGFSGVYRGATHEGDAAPEFVAEKTGEQTTGVKLAPVGHAAHLIEIHANRQPLVHGLIHEGCATVLEPFEVGADGAKIVGIGIEGFGVIGFLVFETATDLNGREKEVEGRFDVVGIAPAHGIGGERFRIEGGDETRFVGETDLAGGLAAIVEGQMFVRQQGWRGLGLSGSDDFSIHVFFRMEVFVL